MAQVVSLEEAKARLSRIGKTPVDVARELEVSVSLVRGVLEGRLKGHHGDAHKVAVTLGLKDGVVVDHTMSIADAMQAAAR